MVIECLQLFGALSQLVGTRFGVTGRRFERPQVRRGPVALLLDRSELLLENLHAMIGLLRITGGCFRQLLADRGQLALGPDRSIQELLGTTVRFLRGFRESGRVAGACLGLDRPGRGFPELHLELAHPLDGFGLLFAELVAELRELLILRADRPAQLLVIRRGAGTGEAHPFPLAEASGSEERERDDGHHEGDRGEAAGDRLHEVPRLAGGLRRSAHTIERPRRLPPARRPPPIRSGV